MHHPDRNERGEVASQEYGRRVLSRREGTLGMDSSRDRGEDLRVDNTTTLPAAQDGRNKAIPF